MRQTSRKMPRKDVRDGEVGRLLLLRILGRQGNAVSSAVAKRSGVFGCEECKRSFVGRQVVRREAQMTIVRGVSEPAAR